MSEKVAARDPLNLILFIASLGGFLLAIILSGIIVFANLFSDSVGMSNGPDYSITTAASIAFVGICALPTSVLSLRALLGHSPLPPRPASSLWLISLVLLPLTFTLGHFAFELGFYPNILGPPAHILTALVPALIVVIIVRRYGPLHSPRRVWGQFLIGVWAIPFTSFLFEIVFLIPTVMAIVLSLMSTEVGRRFVNIMTNPDRWLDPQAYESALQILRQPSVILIILGYVMILVPLIEEAAKTMVIWPLLRRRLSPASAFIGGAIGGAAYGLFEALFLTQPGPAWTTTMIARVGATMMHSFTAGLASWGLNQAVIKRKWGAFGRAYLGAVFMHAFWNGVALVISFGAIASENLSVNLTPSMLDMINFSGVVLLTILSGIALAGLVRIPRKLARDHEHIELDKPLETLGEHTNRGEVVN
ncbi:MAG: hypothetical protein AMJ88_16885 [Anaerolineae bacterium SM23_ 63]|nr:MAG: hypothetical protein AMJ88_16885 [Anaerolineae bacterium SM23_ 63]